MPMRVNGSVQREDALLQQAILQTLVYADLFDYPLTPNEIVRYLGVSAEPATILDQLDPVSYTHLDVYKRQLLDRQIPHQAPWL